MARAPRDLTEFEQGYIECILWLAYQQESEDAEMEQCDDATEDEITARDWRSILRECRDFVVSNRLDLVAAEKTGMTFARMGHDFYLSRCGHGAGFWDEGLGELGDKLHDAASTVRSVSSATASGSGSR